MSEREYEIKLLGGKVVRWHGTDGEDAVRRWYDCVGRRNHQVAYAWREVRHGFFPGVDPRQVIG